MLSLFEFVGSFWLLNCLLTLKNDQCWCYYLWVIASRINVKLTQAAN